MGNIYLGSEHFLSLRTSTFDLPVPFFYNSLPISFKSAQALFAQLLITNQIRLLKCFLNTRHFSFEFSNALFFFSNNVLFSAVVGGDGQGGNCPPLIFSNSYIYINALKQINFSIIMCKTSFSSHHPHPLPYF